MGDEFLLDVKSANNKSSFAPSTEFSDMDTNAIQVKES